MILLFVYIPVCVNFFYSFFRLSSYSAGKTFVGADNFRRLFTDEAFPIMIRNNLYYCIISLVIQVGFGTLVALLLESKLTGKLRNFYRNIYFIPALISLTAVGLLFTFVYSPDLGLINTFLESVGLGRFTQTWLGDSKLAIFCIIAMSQWQFTGYITLLMVVAVQNISSDYTEAAKLTAQAPYGQRLVLYFLLLRNSYWFVPLLQL